ncbi:MAG: bifunctional enoyl-CoA hydratase/phosphate acetyltransferase [Bacteroidales bacterium]
MAIKKLDDIIKAVQKQKPKRVAVAYVHDSHTLEAVNNAYKLGFIVPILVGDKNTMEQLASKVNIDIYNYRLIQEKEDMAAAQKAVELVNQGEADVLMKGTVSSDKYMRAILNKEKGLLPPKATLSHVTVIEVPTYHKLLIVSDVAVIPAPDLVQKIAITNYLINTAHKLGIEQPKIAVIAATEQMTYGMQACVDAAIISKMGERSQIKDAIIDGPLALDVAIDKESVKIKKLVSPVAGDADCLVFPNLESANVFFKSCTKLAKGELAAMVTGAKAPAILTSRGDSSLTKTYSIALACLMA